jgi:Leucine-rich repeat (LRR) protein
MDDADKKRKSKGFRSNSAAATTTRTEARTPHGDGEADGSSAAHVPDGSTRSSVAPSNRRRLTGKGGARIGRDSIPSASAAPSPKRTSQQHGGSSAFLPSEGLESALHSASSSAINPSQRIERASDDAWLSVDLDEIDIDSQQPFVSTTSGGATGGSSIAASPDSPGHPASAARLTLQEVHGVPGAFMSTTTGHYVHREAEAIRQLMGDDSGVDDDRASFLTQADSSRPPTANDAPSSPQPSSSPAALPPPRSSPAVVQASVNEILVEARPVSRSRSFNSEDEYYSYGSGDLASDDRPVTAESLPSAHVQRRYTRRGNNNNRASRLLSLRLQLGEMGGYGDGPPPLLVDAQPIPKRSRAQVLMLVGLGSLAVVAALAVGLSLGLTRPAASSGGTADVPLTPAPSAAPTSSLAGQLRSTLPASTQTALEDATSSQSLAFQHVIAHSATAADTTSTAERMTQQFALLTLFYSTSGEGWTSPWINTTTTSSTAGGSMSDECQWTGIECDINRTVVRLVLESSFLRGPVPPEIALLAQLADLNLASNNQVNGTLPSEIGALTRLTSLALSGDKLSGRLPTEVGKLTMLASLKLDNQYFTGPLPTEIGLLTRLTDLSLTRNQFTSSIPTEVGFLTLLNRFDFFGNNFTSTIPTEVGRLTSATTFHVYDNELSGQIPTEIGKLSAKLTSLFTYNNAFFGTIPTELGNLVGLTSVTIDTCHLVGTIPTELGRLTNAVQLWMFHNDLTGTIPSELGNMAKLLQDFNATVNHLNGTIPPELGNLTSLKGLNLSYNKLTGTIPPELAQIRSLEVLYLYYNQLTGPVPTALGDLPNLRELALIGNSLNGTVSNASALCRQVSSKQLVVAVECTDVPCECDCQCGRW